MRGEAEVRLPPYTVEAMYRALSETVDWGLSAHGIPELWKKSRGAGVKVAVLDTGIDTGHADLRDGIEVARDFTRSRSGVVDRVGHGTHVAGTIGARQNGLGVVGVAPDCRLLVAKVLGDDGGGSGASVAAGIDWACGEGADVLSLSLGSAQASREMEAAVERAVAAGKFVVCAAGNDGRSNSVNYPARWKTTLAVGAVTREGVLADFSSRGPELDLCAPGHDVVSTYVGGSYARLSGTSMATPFVSGVIALVLAKHRRLGGATPVTNREELLEHLLQTATDVGPPGRDPSYGFGLIDPGAALARVGQAVRDRALEIGPLLVNGRRGRLAFVEES